MQSITAGTHDIDVQSYRRSSPAEHRFMVGRPHVRVALNDIWKDKEKKQRKRKHIIADFRSIARPFYKRSSAEHSDTHTHMYTLPNPPQV